MDTFLVFLFAMCFFIAGFVLGMDFYEGYAKEINERNKRDKKIDYIYKTLNRKKYKKNKENRRKKKWY